MKFHKSLTMLPFIISVNGNLFSFEKTNFLFNEDDIRKELILVDKHLIKDSQIDKSIKFDDQYLKLRLRGYVENWHNETMFLSNVSEMINNSNFKNILSLGKSGVPAILEEIKNRPSNLIWALNYIEGFNISKSSVTIVEASKLWIKWGVTKGLIN